MKINTYMYIFNITLLFYFFIYVNFSFYMEFIHFLLKELLKHSFWYKFAGIEWFHIFMSENVYIAFISQSGFGDYIIIDWQLCLETFVLRKLRFSVVPWLTELFKLLSCLCSSMYGTSPLCLLWFSALCYEIPWYSFLHAFLLLKFTDQFRSIDL